MATSLQKINKLIMAAEQGDDKAIYKLAECYFYGEGGGLDKKESVKWYNLAAESGNADAQTKLGICYMKAIGVKKDYKEAVKWFQLAAAQNNASAQCNLGLCYENGDGVTQNDKDAVKWFRKAADQENANGLYNLGLCYFWGKGVKRNLKKSIQLYLKAAKQGHIGAKKELGFCYESGEGVKKNYKESVKYYTEASEQGNAIAQYCLARCYENGTGVKTNIELAMKYYKQSASQFFYKAIIRLSLPFENAINNSNANVTYSPKVKRNTQNIRKKNFSEQEYVVAFIDLLGTTKRIRSDSSEQALKEIINIFNKFTEQNEKYYFFNINEKPQWRIFSDNIVIFLPVNNRLKCNSGNERCFYSFYLIVVISLFFQAWAMERKWPLRGGITIGTFYVDNNLVWGKALDKAYELESIYSINPRIIIDKRYENLLEQVVDRIIKYLPESCKNKERSLIISKDYDYYYLNYQFAYYLDEQAVPIYGNRLFHNLNEFLLAEINNKDNNEKIINKYQWLIKSHNAWCKANNIEHNIYNG